MLTPMNRRAFLKAGGVAAIGTLAGSGAAFAADTEISLSPSEPGAVISPHIYGHFIEHLGGVIYDGVWVRPELVHPQRGRNPQAVCRRHEADRRPESALARRLLCRRLSLARRHRQGLRAAPHLQLLATPHARRNRRH